MSERPHAEKVGTNLARQEVREALIELWAQMLESEWRSLEDGSTARPAHRDDRNESSTSHQP